jgi:hypothetical protein
MPRTYLRPLHKFIENPALPEQGEFSSLDYELLFSPDWSGWYWQRGSDEKTSQLFKSTTDAIVNMKLEINSPGIIEWS